MRWLEPGRRGRELASSLEAELTGRAVLLGFSPADARGFGLGDERLGGPHMGLICYGQGTALLFLELPRALGQFVPSHSLPFPGAAGRPSKGLPTSLWR